MSGNDSKVDELIALVGAMTRFLTRLSQQSAFKKSEFGLAEWSALSIVSARPYVNSRQLAKVLGVSAQRVNQIVDSLRGGGLLTASVVASDARKKVLAVTPRGSARLEGLRLELEPLILTALKARPKAISQCRQLITKSLMQIVLPPTNSPGST